MSGQTVEAPLVEREAPLNTYTVLKGGDPHKAPLNTYTVVWDDMDDSRTVVQAPSLDDVATTQLAEMERAAEATHTAADTSLPVVWEAGIWEGDHPSCREDERVRTVQYIWLPLDYREPKCQDGHDHDWQGGDPRSGGGTVLVYTEQCPHCGYKRERRTDPGDTLAQNPEGTFSRYTAPHFFTLWDDMAAPTYDNDCKSVDDALEESHREAETGYESTEETVWVDYALYACHCPLPNGECIHDVEQAEKVAWGTRTCDPPEPECVHADGHEWTSHVELEGGVKENPGCQGHGGGVVIREHCARQGCAVTRETDSWAQRRDTGEQGLHSVGYGGLNDYSLELKDWLHAEDRGEDPGPRPSRPSYVDIDDYQ